jgi:hypothetical protein
MVYSKGFLTVVLVANCDDLELVDFKDREL